LPQGSPRSTGRKDEGREEVTQRFCLQGLHGEEQDQKIGNFHNAILSQFHYYLAISLFVEEDITGVKHHPPSAIPDQNHGISL
jgi:hypothetical protein